MDLGPDRGRALLEASEREVLEHRGDRLRRTRLDRERGEALPAEPDGRQIQATFEEAHDWIKPGWCARLGREVRVEGGHHTSIRRRARAVGRITDAVRAGGVVDELCQGHTAVAVHARDDEHLDIRGAAAVDEVAEDQDVAHRVVSRVAGIVLKRPITLEAHGFLEEPEADLGVAVDSEAVGAKVEDLVARPGA